MALKQRLDVLLHERGMAPTRAKARGMIMAGEVLVNGVMVDKPGTQISQTANIEIKQRRRFVSRGGEKLAGALHDFQFDATNLICADVGASTGGFTDCLLQHHAGHIYAIDVGYGQIDYGLRQDERVTIMERTNARHLTTLPQPVDLVVVDASFISLRLLLPVFTQWMKPKASVIALIKPQFEAGKDDVGKGGIVRDNAVHQRVLLDILTFAQQTNYHICGLTRSPIKGQTGNIEFLVWLTWPQQAQQQVDIPALIETVT